MKTQLAQVEPSVRWIMELAVTCTGKNGNEHPTGKCQLAYETVMLEEHQLPGLWCNLKARRVFLEPTRTGASSANVLSCGERPPQMLRPGLRFSLKPVRKTQRYRVRWEAGQGAAPGS